MPTLFDAIAGLGQTLPNRIVMAPMTRARAGESRVPNALMAEYYAQRAEAGLILTEATTISEQANGWVGSAGIYNEAMADGWKLVTAAVHARGGRIGCQLWHCGRASHTSFHPPHPPVAPSAIPIQGDYIHTPQGKQPYETPRPLEIPEIPALLEDYRQAARRARQAGFDAVEIGAANGYLLDTFLQSRTNHRTDDYGGSIPNRTRLLREVVEVVLQEWPAVQVGVRISPNGVYNDMGSPDFRDQFLYVAEQLQSYRLGYLHVLDGLGFGFHQLGEPLTLQEFRPLFGGLLIGNCGYTPESAAAAVAAGHADLIAFGRPFMSNPDLVSRLRHGWPLNETAPVAVWYSPGAAGYTDFPTYTPGNDRR